MGNHKPPFGFNSSSDNPLKINRRLFLAGGAGGALAAPSVLRAQAWFGDFPFNLGVASGDPAPDGFVIWTKLAPKPFEPHGGMPITPIPVRWEVAEDDRFRTIAVKGEALARPELGHSVHVEVAGLQPDRRYFYRFFVGSERSLVGRARTAPATGAAVSRLRFAVAGCQHYESGYYTAFRHIAADDDLAFVYHYGDFIYEYAYDYNYAGGLPVPKVRSHRLRSIVSLEDYRQHYAQYLLDMDLQAARARHSFLMSFDDHEIENNWVQDISQEADVPQDVFALRRAAAMQAWYEMMPVRRSMLPRGGQVLASRQIGWGQLAAINLLDTRSFRSDQPCGDGFKPACTGVNDANATVLGAAQEKWLDANLASGGSRWNCIAQQIMMMPLDRRNGIHNDPGEKVLNADSWAAYDAPRRKLMKRFGAAGNVVVLTGDEHQHYAGDLLDGEKIVASECVITSISSGGDGQDVRPGSDEILRRNPQLKFINDQRGYGVCEVMPDTWQTHFMVLDRVSTSGGTLSRRATAQVERGKAGVTVENN